MTNLEIFSIIYMIGFIVNSLLLTSFVNYKKRTEPDRFISPIFVMVCVFLSVVLWVVLLISMVFRFVKKLF